MLRSIGKQSVKSVLKKGKATVGRICRLVSGIYPLLFNNNNNTLKRKVLTSDSFVFCGCMHMADGRRETNNFACFIGGSRIFLEGGDFRNPSKQSERTLRGSGLTGE